MRIKRLYTEPAVITPIEFAAGVNIVIGESDDTSSKNNGVGKSLCIEFLNFALLKRRSESRVAKIPKEHLDRSTFICIDMIMGDEPITIRRSLAEAEHPRIVVGGRETTYAKMTDATNYLTELLLRGREAQVGFREILGPLIRDERSEFKSLVACFDTKARIPDNYSPHLMLLGIDPRIYHEIKEIQRELDQIAAEEQRIKESVKLVRQKDFDEARSDLNELNEEVEKIQEGINSLENMPAYDIVKGEILAVESQMDDLRLRKEVLTRRVASLSPIAVEDRIPADEIRDFYNELRAGLGSNVVRELRQVLSFKDKIEKFQRHLLEEKVRVLDVEVREINKQLSHLDRQYAKLLSVLNQNGELKNLRQTYASFQAKSDELGQLKSFFGRYDELLIDRQTRKSEIEADRLLLQASVSTAAEGLRSFERTILDIHNFIQGSKKASFEVRVTSKKQVIEIILRIDDDGSHSVEREKVFIYDIALMLNHYTRPRHPGLLVHDNIFDVDDDTLQKSLEYILTRAPWADEQQYILTLNVDRLEHCRDEPWFFDLEQSVVATFTKSQRFLKSHYQELG